MGGREGVRAGAVLSANAQRGRAAQRTKNVTFLGQGAKCLGAAILICYKALVPLVFSKSRKLALTTEQ